MKKSLIIVFLSIFAFGAKAQEKSLDTATFKVEGICEMCKERIENAAYIKGVKKVDWDKETKMITIVYKPGKVTVQQVADSIAKAGHDNEYAKAEMSDYDKVHGCCKYREDESH
jgi:mercuric ion binding protein